MRATVAGLSRDAISGGQEDHLHVQVCQRERPDLVGALSGVRLSGTQVSGAMYREFRAALSTGLVGVSYGNTFGNAAGLPAEQDGDLLPYLPNYPHVTMAVVDKADWSATVGYGEVGQVRLTVLHEDLFLPNVCERDQAVRYDTGLQWPCDGVANVRPLQITTAAPEGLYQEVWR
ncbi:MAG TPA: hypothetical protein VGS19_03960 [Streptosporangiaceae bacterium]|nr:hypothetical protein [Streptosporangiaceae bacterium]